MNVGAGPRDHRAALRSAERRLSAAGVENARSEAERLLTRAAGLPSSGLCGAGTTPLRPSELEALEALVRRRSRGEPLQHIEGEVEFREIVLRCDARALIPRPETEQLVERIRCWVGDPLKRVLDIGTGSGAIGLSLLAEGIAERVVGIDVSPPALELAGENRERCGLADRFELRSCGSDPYGCLVPGETFDAIVSNPPYVRSSEIADLPVEVRAHDPLVALEAGEDGLAIIRRIARGAIDRLEPAGGLFLEIGATQGSYVRSLLVESGPWTQVRIERDYTDRDRFAVALL